MRRRALCGASKRRSCGGRRRFNSIRQVIGRNGVSPEAIKGIGLTGQMHGLVLLDKAGQVLRPAILWNDQRTGAECDEIRGRLGKAAPDPDHRQRRPNRLHRAQDPVGAGQRAGDLWPYRPHPAAQGLRALAS
jgi:hypothetical protein